MIVFLGVFRHTVDEKQRVAIPSKFREQIAASGDAYLYAVARKSYIAVFPAESWEHFVKSLLSDESRKELTEGYHALRRQVAKYGENCRLDSQGRISLRTDQLERAGIGRSCVVFGNFGVIELWDEDRFKEEHDDLDAQRTDRYWMDVTQGV